MISLGSVRPWAAILFKSLYISAISGRKGKSIRRPQTTPVSQVELDVMISLSFQGPCATILHGITCILATFGPNQRPAKPEKCLFKGKSISRSQTTFMPQVTLDLMISIGSLGP